MASNEDDVQPIFCAHCATSFTAAKNLHAHIRTFHPAESVNIQINLSSRILCGMCHMKFNSVKNLHEHFQASHPEVALEFVTKTFTSKTEFESWKRVYEKETMSLFVAAYSRTLLFDKSIVRRFQCHRSGFSRVKETGRKRTLKRDGVNKIGATCPATMKVIEKVTNGIKEFEVQMQTTHVGHALEMRRLPLTKEERKNLAFQLSIGVSKSQLLTSVRANCSPTKRISFISRKDLHNVVRDFKITEGVICNADGPLSVEDQVQEQQLVVTQILQANAVPETNMTERKSALLNKVNNLIMTCESAEKLKYLEDTFAIAAANIDIMI